MRIISWNVNGIRACRKKGFYDWFLKESPDILCLQETKAYPDQLDEELVSPKGYFTYWNNPVKKGYAGVAILAKKEPKSVLYDFPPKSFDTEGRAIAADFGNFILINVYFPNGGMGAHRLSYKMDFYAKFLKYTDSIKTRNLIICGDVNTAHKEIDLARPRENEMNTGFLPEERAWIDSLIERGYVDTFRHFNKEASNYTWWDYKTGARERNVGWRIDYFFTTKNFIKNIKNSFIKPEIMGSDHCPIGIEL